MFKFSFVLLLFTLPLLGGEPLWGVPLWVWGSLGVTALYALVLIITIETQWDGLKGSPLE
jgi:hypothetical protein